MGLRDAPRQLLTTHVGADLDGVAAMVLARRLHPDARLFFPGSKQESVRRLVADGELTLDEVSRRQVAPGLLERIVVCDCRQADRLGVVAEWLDGHSGDLVLYDHHQASGEALTPHDPPDGPSSRLDPEVGAATTLIVEALTEAGLVISPGEATLGLLGIYEDTGSLTHPTTAPRDAQAVARLLAAGGDLAVVRRYAVGKLDPLRLDLLHSMVHGLVRHQIHGLRVGIARLDLVELVDELAPLVSRLLDIAELDLAFGLIAEPDRVVLIARGAVPGFDLGRLAACVAGGGGHATAASGNVRSATSVELEATLLAYLERELPPAARAADLMISEFRTVEASTTVNRTRHLLNRWRINAAPVTAGSRVVGAVTRQGLDAAMQHGLQQRPVTTVMDTDLVWVDPATPADALADHFLSRHPRVILVGQASSGHAEGVVSRMAVLRYLHGILAKVDGKLERHHAQQGSEQQPAQKLLARLSAEAHELIDLVTALAADHTVVYLVGGLVRDLLLERPNQDLDLVVEGDGPAFAARLAAAITGARVRVHQAFLTAVVVLPDGRHVDVATARSEFYRAPAALPEVTTSVLRQDLYRRDFTINTLAIRLSGQRELIDFFGGRRDLAERRLRVLHSLSFLDDPTRVLRAVRFELRLGFTIAPETTRLIHVALQEKVFARLSGVRLREELRLLLDRPGTAVRGLERLAELGVLETFAPWLELDAQLRGELEAGMAAFDWWVFERPSGPTVEAWRLVLLILARQARHELRSELADRLDLAGPTRDIVEHGPDRLARVRTRLVDPAVLPHQVRSELAGLSGEERLLLLADDEPVRGWARRDWLELATLKLTISGRDLLARGARAGPALGEALARTLNARLDGEISPDQELEVALRSLDLP